MKKSSLAIVTIGAILVLNLSLAFGVAKANFTGTWVMDKSKAKEYHPMSNRL